MKSVKEKWEVYYIKFNVIQEEKSILQQIINLIYPPVCAFCGKIDENFLCKECNSKLERLTDLHIQKYRNKTYTEHIFLLFKKTCTIVL